MFFTLCYPMITTLRFPRKVSPTRSLRFIRGSIHRRPRIFLAAMKSWDAPFVRTGSLEALAVHIAEERGKEGSYAPYCSFVQSSGMGKSRLLDEFSKEHFLIPVNLRRANARGTYHPHFYPYVPSHPCSRLSSSRRRRSRPSHQI